MQIVTKEPFKIQDWRFYMIVTIKYSNQETFKKVGLSEAETIADYTTN